VDASHPRLIVRRRERNLRVTTLDLRNSGDTAGRRDRVVGYGAFALGQKQRQLSQGAPFPQNHEGTGNHA